MYSELKIFNCALSTEFVLYIYYISLVRVRFFIENI